MEKLEKQVNALIRLCTAEKESERRQLRSELLQLMSAKPVPKDPEDLIREILLELGAPENLLGHPYMVEAILLVVSDRTYIDNVTFGLYPQVAAHFDTTAGRVERAMRHLLEVTWSRGDMEILNRYFGNSVSAWKGKPTNSEFIARIANIVKRRMKDAA